MSMFGIVRENAFINEFDNVGYKYVGESYEADATKYQQDYMLQI